MASGWGILDRVIGALTVIEFEPTSEQTSLIDNVRRFVREEIIPLEADLDPDAASLRPDDFARLRQKAIDLGLHGMDTPAEYGGPGLDVMTRTLLAIETSQHRAGLYASCYGGFGGAGLAQMYEANEDQKG